MREKESLMLSHPEYFNKIKIELGSGSYPRGIELGFWHADSQYPLPHQEFCCDIEQLPFKESSFFAIHMNHSLEHISWRKIPAVLVNLRRILVEGGYLMVVVPNLLYVAKKLLENPDDTKEIMPDTNGNPLLLQDLYSSQTNDGMQHRCGFTPESIYQLFQQAGFSEVAVPRDRFDSNIEAWGYK